MCLPGCLRLRGIRNPTGFYLHVPFPSPDAVAVAPGIRGLIQDVLAADLLGFQTESDRDNFASSAVNFGGAHRTGDATMSLDGREVRLGVFPAEISAREFAATAEAQAQAGEGDNLFGSVGTRDIAEALHKRGIELDRKHIELPNAIKALGEYDVAVRLGAGVTGTFKVKVTAS